jgi:hypothetical protein
MAHVMNAGTSFDFGDSRTSENGRYTFIFQDDGNLVLYSRNRPLWASNTDGQPAAICTMQYDGNLVIYDRDNHSLWHSGTWGNDGSRLIVQDDGNVVIYRPDGAAIWATNTPQ